MTNSRYDLATMKLSLAKNKLDLNKLSKRHVPKDENGFSRNIFDIGVLIDTIGNIHNMLEMADSLLVEEAKSSQDYKNLCEELFKVVDAHCKNIDVQIANVIEPFPVEKIAEVRLITNGIKNNLEATLKELSVVSEKNQQLLLTNFACKK